MADDQGTVIFRPRLVRAVGFAIGGLVLLASLVAAVVVPAGFSLVDRVGFAAFGIAVFVFCYREATVRVDAGPDRLRVRNLFSSRDLEWAEVIAVSFPEGDPWAHLDLADGDTLSTMAIQRADGQRGIRDARHLAALVRERGEAADIA